MTARLIAATVPVDPAYGANIGEFIAYVARVSNPANQINHETAARLLKYLEDKKHWSPFEMANIVIEVETTRDIARQFLRHRSFSFQEFSQRYAEVSNFADPRPARLQDVKNRQNSIKVDDSDDARDLEKWWKFQQEESLGVANTIYIEALKRGIAKEVARSVLPEGLTMSRLYVNGTVRSWLHYLSVRLDPGTQKEHRDLAVEIAAVVEGVLQR